MNTFFVGNSFAVETERHKIGYGRIAQAVLQGKQNTLVGVLRLPKVYNCFNKRLGIIGISSGQVCEIKKDYITKESLSGQCSIADQGSFPEDRVLMNQTY